MTTALEHPNNEAAVAYQTTAASDRFHLILAKSTGGVVEIVNELLAFC